MKLLVSDYDGTFKESTKSGSVEKNVAAVKRFLDNGNMFSIATGRSYISIKRETDRFHIPYNYLICNNGSVIFDENDKIIYHNPIKLQILIKTLNYLESLGFIKSIELRDMYGEETTSYEDTTEIICTIKIRNILDLKYIKQELAFLQSLSFLTITILKERIDKKDAIEYISSLHGIEKKHIYTVGDEFNDEGMLREFNGHKMLFSNPILFNKGIKTTTSVRKLIQKIERR